MMNRFRIVWFLACLAGGADLSGASVLGKKRKHPEESSSRVERAQQVYLHQYENIDAALFMISYICSLPRQSSIVAAAKDYEVDIAQQLRWAPERAVSLITEYAGLKSNIWLEYAKNVLGAGEWDLYSFLPRLQRRYPKLFKDPQFFAESLIGCIAEDMGQVHTYTPFEYILEQEMRCKHHTQNAVVYSSGCTPLSIRPGPFFEGLEYALAEADFSCSCHDKTPPPVQYAKLPTFLVTRTQPGSYAEVPEFLWSDGLCSPQQKMDWGPRRYRLLAYMYRLIPGTSPYPSLNNGERMVLLRAGSDWHHKWFSRVEKVPQPYVNELLGNKNGTHQPTLQVYERMDYEMNPAQRKLAEVLALRERR